MSATRTPRNLRQLKPDERTKYLRREDVEQRYCVKTSTLYDWITAGSFPAPIKIGTGHAARWSLQELDAYDAARAAERPQEPDQAA